MSDTRGLRPHQIVGYEYVPPNLLTNGGFGIWQRNTDATYTGANYFMTGADEWMLAYSEAADSVRVLRNSSMVPAGATYSCELRPLTTTKSWTLNSCIECAPELSGLTITFSIDVWSTSRADRIWIGAYNGSTYVYSPTIYHSGSGNWERLTAILTMPTVVNGANRSYGYAHTFGIRCSVGNDGYNHTFYVANAMAVVGKYPEGVPYVPLTPAEDWERCQRFYQAGTVLYECPITGAWTGFPPGEWVPPQNAGWMITETYLFNTPMASTPTLTWSSVSAHNSAYDSKGAFSNEGFYVTYDTTGTPGSGSTDPNGYDPTFRGDWTAYIP